MKKTVIVTASIGAGHNQVAYALKESLLGLNKEQEVSIIDLLEEKYIYQMANSLYLKTITRMPSVFSKAYDFTQHLQHDTNVTSLLNYHCYKYLQQIQLRLNPDLFLFTHPFPAAAYKNNLNTPAYAVLTDFGYHSFWLNPHLTGYFISRHRQKKSLVSRGIPSNQIKITGIPIRKEFMTNTTASHKTRQFPDQPQVLLMGGGLGIGPMLHLVNAIIDAGIESRFVMVAGNNQTLYKEVVGKTKDLKNWEVHGFTHDVPKLMHSSTLLVTKAGAVTLSEASTSGLPTIILNPLPGHEVENAGIAVAEGWASSTNSVEKTVYSLGELLSNSDQLSKMRDNAIDSSHPEASKRVISCLENKFTLERRQQVC